MARPYSRAKHQLAALFLSSGGRVTLLLRGRGLGLFVGQRVPKRAKAERRTLPNLVDPPRTDRRH